MTTIVGWVDTRAVMHLCLPCGEAAPPVSETDRVPIFSTEDACIYRCDQCNEPSDDWWRRWDFMNALTEETIEFFYSDAPDMVRWRTQDKVQEAVLERGFPSEWLDDEELEDIVRVALDATLTEYGQSFLDEDRAAEAATYDGDLFTHIEEE